MNKEPKGLFSSLGKDSFEPQKRIESAVVDSSTNILDIDELKEKTKRKSYDLSLYNIKRLMICKSLREMHLNEIVNIAVTEYLDKLGIKLPGED